MLVGIVEDRDVKRAMARATAAVRSMSRPMAEIARIMEQHIRGSFRDERSPWGDAWAPHSPVTLALRKKEGIASRQRLLKSGIMYSSLKSTSDALRANVSMGEGASAAYVEVHQFGNPKNKMFKGPAAPIPARPSFPIRAPSDTEPAFPADWLRQVYTPLEAYMAEAFR